MWRKNMKKLYIFCVFLCLTFFKVPHLLNAQTLDEAILAAAVRISRDLPAGTKVAVISFDSVSENLNNYVINELNGTILRNRRITPVIPNQRQLQTIRGDLHFNFTGDLSFESAQSIGQLLEVEHLITGSLELVGINYRFVLNAVDTEHAILQSQYTASLDLRNDQQLVFLLGAAQQHLSRPQQEPAIQPTEEPVLQPDYIFEAQVEEVQPAMTQPEIFKLPDDAWRNKWVYLGAGTGIFIDAYNHKTLVADYMVTLMADFALTKWFSLGLNLAYLFDEIFLDASIQAKIGWRFPRTEFFIIAGYKPIWDIPFIGGASLGFKLGPGILFSEFSIGAITIEGSGGYYDHDGIYHPGGGGGNNEISFLTVGYKIGIGDKKR
jgi:hypothetical protein